MWIRPETADPQRVRTTPRAEARGACIPHRVPLPTSGVPPCLVLAGILLATACSVLEPDRGWERTVGVIEVGGIPEPPVQVPASARAGVPFVATIVTFGSGSCTRPDGAEVAIDGLAAAITPYDLVYRGPGRRGGGDIACTDDLASFPREVQLRFDEPGEAKILIVGRALLGDRPTEFRVAISVDP